MRRWPKLLSPFANIWNRETADTVHEAIQSLFKGMSGLQGTPDTPTEISAGDTSDVGTGQPVALSNHTHGVNTAAPSVDVALGGVTDEGSGTSLMRSDARLKLAPGLVPGDFLEWTGTTWASVSRRPLVLGLDGHDGDDGPMGPPGMRGIDGAAGVAGSAGPIGLSGFPGRDGEDGMDGLPGARGVDGIIGVNGAPGPAGIGFPGMDGDDGRDGYSIIGPVGPQGPAGGGGGGTWTELDVDFGSIPVWDASFVITDAAITSSAVKLIVVPCGKAATGRTADDWQWDGAIFAASPGSGSAICYATFHPGPISGRRMIQYTVA